MTESELREIDARVHREVMGRECRWVARGPEGQYSRAVFTACRDWLVDDWYDPVANMEVPAYSTDMAAAWRVVEKLAEGHYVKVACFESHYHGASCRVSAGDESQRFDGDVVVRDGNSASVPESCTSMPLAICIAALEAVQPKVTA